MYLMFAGVAIMAGLVRISMAIEELANSIRAFPHITKSVKEQSK